MKHLEEYNRIILFRQQHPLPKELYGERHHIVPRSICPLLEKAKDNIIRLTAQEHFLAHYHLYLAYKEELNEPKWAKKLSEIMSGKLKGNKNAVGSKGHTGLKWITNGIEERAIPVGQTPPNGWRFGRRFSKKNKKK